MDLQNEERETGLRRIPKCVGFNMPTRRQSYRGQSSMSASRPDLSALADTRTQDGGKGAGHKSRKREDKRIKAENVSEVIEARTMRRRENGAYECVKDVIWADVCSPRVSVRGHSV